MDKKSMLESYLRGLGQDLSFNMIDEGEAKIRELIGEGDYEQLAEKIRNEYSQAESDNPKSYMAGELSGTAGSLLIPGGAAKAALKGAKRLALESVAKNALGTYGRSNGEELSAGDMAMVASSGLPMSKISNKIPWKVGKGVKKIEDGVEDNFGKVTNKLDPLQEAQLKVKGKVLQKLDPIQEAELGFGGKVIQKLDPKQEAALVTKGGVHWEGGSSPTRSKMKEQAEDLAENESNRISQAKKRIETRKELENTENAISSMQKEVKQAEDTLPLSPSLRRQFFEEKSKELGQSQQNKDKLLNLLQSLKSK